MPGSTPARSCGGKTVTVDDVPLDVGRLMDSVRAEVTALMQEGVQKTASYCASLCAERIVAARREMQQRYAEERRELEKFYGVRVGRSSAVGALQAPNGAPCPGSGSTYRAPQRSPMLSLTAPSKSVPASPCPQSASLGMMPRAPAAPLPPQSGRCNGVHRPASNAGASLRSGPSATGVCKGGGSIQEASPGAIGPAAIGGVPSSPCPTHEAYDTAYIDTHDAVQTLEERTNMASRVMDLLEEALQAASTTAGTPTAAAPGATGFTVDSAAPHAIDVHGAHSTVESCNTSYAARSALASRYREEHAPSTKALTTPVPSSWGPSTTQCAVVPGRAGSDEVSAQQEVPVRAPARFAAAVYNQDDDEMDRYGDMEAPAEQGMYIHSRSMEDAAPGREERRGRTAYRDRSVGLISQSSIADSVPAGDLFGR